MLNEERGEDTADWIQAAEEGRRDTVKAHRRHRRGTAVPLLITGQIEHRRTDTCQRTADCEREHDILFFGHTAVFRSILIIAGRLQFVAELCFFKQDPDADRDQDRNRNGDRRVLVVAEYFIQTRVRDQRALVDARDAQRVRAGAFLDLGQQNIDAVK